MKRYLRELVIWLVYLAIVLPVCLWIVEPRIPDNWPWAGAFLLGCCICMPTFAFVSRLADRYWKLEMKP